MSAPRLMRTGSWNKLSGVRFSWKIITTWLILPGGGGGGGGLVFDATPPQPFKLIKKPARPMTVPSSSTTFTRVIAFSPEEKQPKRGANRAPRPDDPDEPGPTIRRVLTHACIKFSCTEI